MPTTTGSPLALPYPEHDKLGPLGPKPSAIHDAVALRNVLIRAFEAATHDARDAVGGFDQSATAAVHQSRKALRRARAVLGLVRAALPNSEYRAVKAALKEARRALSTVRDHAVAPEALAHLALDDDDRAIADRVLANAAGAVPAAAEIKQLLAESAARAAAQAEALQTALRQEIDWDTVAEGLRTTYGDARRASRAATRSKSWFHTWRRRSKEFVYQLELIAGHAGPRVTAIHSELSGVTDTLGPAVDLIMLREFITTFAQGIPPEATRHLRDSIDGLLDEQMKTARKAARDAFRQKPKKFEKRITKSLHRDLASPDDASAPRDLHE
ncbi:MAG TPA: CHAD domain-containing protein [Kofleriaceae bacterium]|jgi:CHAD domain-containing protein|nr:CHAD domain-containing protein [Kofleriaceae bacterium]